jgi:hypothetical protein
MALLEERFRDDSEKMIMKNPTMRQQETFSTNVQSISDDSRYNRNMMSQEISIDRLGTIKEQELLDQSLREEDEVLNSIIEEELAQ